MEEAFLFRQLSRRKRVMVPPIIHKRKDFKDQPALGGVPLKASVRLIFSSLTGLFSCAD